MKQIFAAWMLMAVFTSNAQIGVQSESIDRSTPIDTARYKVTYSLNYTCHPRADVRYDDVRTLLIGRRDVKDHSDIIFHYDSLCTADLKRGADAFSNPPGSPWPYEMVLSDRGRAADIKYRLPIGCGTLHYSEPVPGFNWNFIADSTKTIIGYECGLATTKFGGRKYYAWFTTELPIPSGPYKFGGLPGLIMEIRDEEKQFIWEATSFEQVSDAICVYEYRDEKNCSAEEAAKTIARCFKAPNAFLLSALGGGKGRLVIVGKDGRDRDGTEVEETPIPYIPIEIK